MIVPSGLSIIKSPESVKYRINLIQGDKYAKARIWFPGPENTILDPNGLCREIMHLYEGPPMELAFDPKVRAFCVAVLVRMRQSGPEIEPVLCFCDFLYPIFRSAGERGVWNKELVDFAIVTREQDFTYYSTRYH
jgi:hypothetical protein